MDQPPKTVPAGLFVNGGMSWIIVLIFFFFFLREGEGFEGILIGMRGVVPLILKQQ